MSEGSSFATETRGISKRFPGVQALESVNFQVRRGEVMGLLGGNGAGKSTLINIVAGRLRPDGGEIYVNGRRVHLQTPSDALDAGLGFLFQDLYLIPQMSVANNVFLGKLILKKRGMVNDRQMKQISAELLSRVGGGSISPNSKVSDLSPRECYLVAIARALANKAMTLFLDEPTAGLEGHDVKSLFSSIEDLKKQGVGVVLVTHRLEEALAVCDRITVLYEGRLKGVFERERTDVKSLASLISGGEVAHCAAVHEATQDLTGSHLFKVENLCTKQVRNVSFRVTRGEIVGIVGVEGSGAGEIVRAIFGLDESKAGKVELDRRQVNPRDPANCIREGIFLLPRDRRGKGLFYGRLVPDNITIANFDSVVYPFLPSVINKSKESSVVSKLAELVKLAPRMCRLNVEALSGGNQQRVLLARALGAKAKVLMLDEPTSGLDVRAKADLCLTLVNLAREGVTIIVHDSAFEEFIGVCDRFIVMKDGELVCEEPGATATEQRLAFLIYYGKGLES